METPVHHWCVHKHTQAWTHWCLIKAYDTPCGFDYSISKNLPVSWSVTLALKAPLPLTSPTHVTMPLFFCSPPSISSHLSAMVYLLSSRILYHPIPPFLFRFSCPFLPAPTCPSQHALRNIMWPKPHSIELWWKKGSQGSETHQCAGTHSYTRL